MSNAVVHTDRLENIWLDKARSTRRIDAAVSLVMGVNAWKFGGADQAGAAKHNAPWTGELLVI